jgi:transcriptional regulator NrdR family protein
MSGIPCRKCGQTDLQVTKTKREKGSVVRLRKCLGCGVTTKTIERDERAASAAESTSGPAVAASVRNLLDSFDLNPYSR